jgi:hypothetical protein
LPKSPKSKAAEYSVNNLSLNDLHTNTTLGSLGMPNGNGDSISLLGESSNTPGQDYALTSENKEDSATTDSSIIINDVAEKDQLTYAKVVAFKPDLNNNTIELMKMEVMKHPETFQIHNKRIVK